MLRGPANVNCVTDFGVGEGDDDNDDLSSFDAMLTIEKIEKGRALQ